MQSRQFSRRLRIAEVDHATLTEQAVAGTNYASYASPWVKTESFGDLVNGVLKGTLIASKRGLPTDGTLNASWTCVVQGRMYPGGPEATVATIPLSDMNEPAVGNPVSFDTITGAVVYPEMRVLISAYAISSDGIVSIAKDTVNDGITFLHPGTAPTGVDRMHIYRPTGDPIAAKNAALGRKHPVVIYLRPAATAYNTSPALTNTPLAVSGNEVPWYAVSKGWACIEARAIGLNDTDGGGAAGFHKTGALNLSVITAHDARKTVAWVTQWIRNRGVHLYDLDPDRIVVIGQRDGGAHALHACYSTQSIMGDPSSSNSQLRQVGRPNACVVIDPDVDWGCMGLALRCPLRNATDPQTASSATGTITAAVGLGADSDALTFATSFTLSPARTLFTKALSDAIRVEAAQTPCYISTGLASNNMGSKTFTWNAGNAVYDRLHSSVGIPTATAQFDAFHGFLWRSAIREFGRVYGLDSSTLCQLSVLNHAGTEPTGAGMAELISRRNTTLATIIPDALDWASAYLQAETRPLGVAPRYTFDIVY